MFKEFSFEKYKQIIQILFISIFLKLKKITITNHCHLNRSVGLNFYATFGIFQAFS